MKRQFENIDIQCWEHKGRRLGFRRPYICLQAAPNGCGALLAAVDELAAEEAPARRKLTLKTCPREKACSVIRLLLVAPTDDLEEMSFTIAGDTVILEFTSAGLQQFRDSVLAWQNGAEDFSVHPSRKTKRQKDKSSGEVWFWTLATDP